MNDFAVGYASEVLIGEDQIRIIREALREFIESNRPSRIESDKDGITATYLERYIRPGQTWDDYLRREHGMQKIGDFAKDDLLSILAIMSPFDRHGLAFISQNKTCSLYAYVLQLQSGVKMLVGSSRALVRRAIEYDLL